LFKAGVFKNKSVAASIGGGLDRGRGLSPEGRQLIVDAIERNKLNLLMKSTLKTAFKEELRSTTSIEKKINKSLH